MRRIITAAIMKSTAPSKIPKLYATPIDEEQILSPMPLYWDWTRKWETHPVRYNESDNEGSEDGEQEDEEQDEDLLPEENENAEYTYESEEENETDLSDGEQDDEYGNEESDVDEEEEGDPYQEESDIDPFADLEDNDSSEEHGTAESVNSLDNLDASSQESTYYIIGGEQRYVPGFPLLSNIGPEYRAAHAKQIRSLSRHFPSSPTPLSWHAIRTMENSYAAAATVGFLDDSWMGDDWDAAAVESWKSWVGDRKTAEKRKRNKRVIKVETTKGGIGEWIYRCVIALWKVLEKLFAPRG